MAQLHFSVDEATARALADQAKMAGKSLSKYLADVVGRSVPPSWPAGYLDTVLGCIQPEDLAEPDDLEPRPIDL